MSHSVRKRETFYLGGYDPRGARYYHKLYKKEAALLLENNGMKISVGNRKRTHPHVQMWQIESQTKDNKTESNYHFLEWDDMIRKDWKKSFFALILDFIFYFKTYILSGRFSQYMFISPYQMVGIFLPSVYIFASLSASAFLSYKLTLFLSMPEGVLLGIGLFLLSVYLILKLGEKLAIFWLLRIFVFSGRYVFTEQRNLNNRLDTFCEYMETCIKDAKTNNVDEILLVTHSVGSILIIPLLDKLLKQIGDESEVTLSVLVLGECIPLVSGLSSAMEYREKMAYVAKSKKLFWVDYTTLIDGACFPQLNYFEDVNIEIEKKENFHFLSARFHTLFSKHRYKALRKNKYLTHFIYFMATDFLGNYDFFRMTAGNTQLSESIQFQDIKIKEKSK